MRRNTQHFRHWLYLYPKVTVKADLRHFHLISNTLYGWYWGHIYLQNKKVVFSNKWATIMYFVALSHSSHTFTWLGRYAAAMRASAFCLFPLVTPATLLSIALPFISSQAFLKAAESVKPIFFNRFAIVATMRRIAWMFFIVFRSFRFFYVVNLDYGYIILLVQL